jgi:hypothetical protein
LGLADVGFLGQNFGSEFAGSKVSANTNFFTFNIVAKMWTGKEKFISVHLKVETDITT